MKIIASQREGRLTVQLSGELDHHAARIVMNKIDSLIDIGLPRDCVLDMLDLSFMDSSGIAVVLKTYKKMREIDGRMWIENVQQQPLRVMDAAGIDRLISITELQK
jgi:stage II sporulation protein AA (anti-sigma F factor antagonist)